MRLVLSMIVKNESETILRCLRSVCNLIDYWVIYDTGSTDGTQEIIKSFFETECPIKGELHESVFVDFSTNRNECLEKAKARGSHVLLLDADMELRISQGLVTWASTKDKLTELCSRFSKLTIRPVGNCSYQRHLILESRLSWKYHGVTHEYVDVEGKQSEPSQVEIPDTILMLVDHYDGGARSDKLERDIRLLETQVVNNPDDARSRFYLARSYYDSGNYLKAKEHFYIRTLLGGWSEECWYAQYQYAQSCESLSQRSDAVMAYLKAIEMRPTRLEAHQQAINLLNNMGLYQVAYAIGVTALKKNTHDFGFVLDNHPGLKDILFVDMSVYNWSLFDVFAVSCHYVGDSVKALLYGGLALKNNPNEPRLKDNLLYYENAKRENP